MLFSAISILKSLRSLGGGGGVAQKALGALSYPTLVPSHVTLEGIP